MMKGYIDNIIASFNSIPKQRKEKLKEIAVNIMNKLAKNEPVKMIFICTHNSRRSHFGQIWAQIAAYHYNIDGIACYSGGTEATAFNPRAVAALQRSGMKIEKTEHSENPVYEVFIAEDHCSWKVFSKEYQHRCNPQKGFIAIMTCNEANEACPIVFGAAVRFPLTYEDPKVADNTPEEKSKYDERCQQIATEMFYLFSKTL